MQKTRTMRIMAKENSAKQNPFKICLKNWQGYNYMPRINFVIIVLPFFSIIVQRREIILSISSVMTIEFDDFLLLATAESGISEHAVFINCSKKEKTMKKFSE